MRNFTPRRSDHLADSAVQFVSGIHTWTLLALLGVAALLGSSLAPQPAAQEQEAAVPDELSETYGAWTLRCAATAGCHVFQGLFRTEDRVRLVRVTLFPGEDDTLRLRVLSPLGPELGSGVALAVDGELRATLPFLSCWQRGCVADMPLTPEIEAALRGGDTLAVTVTSADTGQTVRFELALEGLAQALDQLSER